MKDKKAQVPWSLLKKPFMEMSEAEQELAFDSVASGLDESILKEARAGRPPAMLVCAVLTSSSGERQVVYENIDHNDGDGLECVEEFVEGIERRGALQKGESLDIIEVPITLKMLEGK